MFAENWVERIPKLSTINKSCSKARIIIILISTQSGHYESLAVHLMVERCVQVDV